MLKNIFTGFIFLLSGSVFHSATGQSPLVKQFDVRYGGRQADFVFDFQQTTDGGYILGGFSASGIGGDKTQASRGANDYWIVKTDASGSIQWEKRFGGNLTDNLCSVQQTRDGGYILGGSSLSGSNGDKTQTGRGLNDYWIVKVNAAGVKEWDQRFGGDDEDFFTSVQQTSDGGYFLSGISRSDSSGDKTQATKGGYDYWIVKTDSLGNKIWDVDLGGTDSEQLSAGIQLRDGGYILGGSSPSGVGGDKTVPTWGDYDYWIVKTDSLGVKLWDVDIGGTVVDILESLMPTADSGFIVGGFSRSGASGNKTQASWGSGDYWIIKIDSIGTINWDADFGSSMLDDEVGSTLQTNDGGYLICGESQSPAGGNKTESNLGVSQVWIVKTDSAGTLEWEKTILTSPEQKLSPHALQNDDGCFAIALGSWSDSAGYKTQPNWDTTNSSTDFWIITYCDSTGIPVTQITTDQSLCPGTCTSFNNFSMFATSYLWNFSGANPDTSSDENPQNICYSTPGVYDVTLIATNSAGSDTLFLSNFITIYPFPPPQSIMQQGDSLIALQGSYAYQWYFNGSPVAGATEYLYVASVSGNYNVVCTDSNGCEVEAAIFDVIASLQSPGEKNLVTIHPNPVKNELVIESDNLGIRDIRIMTVTGKVVMDLTYSTSSVDVSSLSAGYYIIEFRNKEAVFRGNFLKENQ